MNPAPVPHCRVLELGCGVGANHPHGLPASGQHVRGIDLSRRTIDKGLQTIVALQLTNIQLLHLDIMDITSDFGAFDYVIAHGVYSWVPHVVRKNAVGVQEQSRAAWSHMSVATPIPALICAILRVA